MCRNIRQLYNFKPPATKGEIDASALQFVRKVSGFTHPSKVNEEPFDKAVHDVSHIVRDLLESLETDAEPKNREEEAAKARARAEKRFGTSVG